jgi:hypothetical protein
MFSVSKFLRKPNPFANENGYNDAWLGLSKANPYIVDSVDYQQYEWGYQEGLDDVEEFKSTPYTYPSNGYEGV